MASQEEDKQSSPTLTETKPAEDEPKDMADKDQPTSVKATSDKVDEHERPPSRHLWVGNVASSVTKEELSEQFSRFGDLENVADYPSRNYAFVNFKSVDDAVYAKKGLHGFVLGGMALRIEFARGGNRSESHHWGDEADAPQDQGHSDAGSMKAFERSKRDRDEPSETLWVGFPLCMKMDERKLHKAFSPFGGIERITTFPGRTYAFVEFHSIKAAARAKNVLQGKLFNDPRVSISFSKSEVGPVEQHHGKSSGPVLSPPQTVRELPPALLPKPGAYVNPRNDRYLSLESNRTYNANPRRHFEDGANEVNMLYPGSRYESGFRDSIERDARQDRNYIRNAEMDLWPSRTVSGGGFVQSRHTQSHLDDRWSVHDEGSGRRDPKRPRPGASLNLPIRSPVDSYLTKMDIVSSNQVESWEDQEGPNRFAQGRRQPLHGYTMDSSRSDWVHHAQVDHGLKDSLHWQGVIAKSGTIVCHARCYTVGNISSVSLPESVNCTARTSLEMLAKHINEVGEFSLLSFVPLGELDVEPYQDFVAYLSDKNRAAVCKVSQECTLFLVPPSEFVELFLKASRSNGIIGVMLKLQQPFSSSTAEPASILPPMKAERLISTGLVPEVAYQSPSIGAIEARSIEPSYQHLGHRAPEVRLPTFNSREAATSQPLLPQHVSSSSNSSYSPIIGSLSSAAGGFNDSGAGPFQNHGLPSDETWAPNLPPGYAPSQHSTPLRGGFSLAPTTAELSLPEASMQQQLASIPVISNPPGYSSSSTQNYGQAKDVVPNLTTPSYPRQAPPLPQYPHPSTQQQKAPQVMPAIQPDQLAQLLSLTAQQTQQTQQSQHLHDNLQSFANSQPQQILGASLSNFGSVMSASLQPQHSRNNVGVGGGNAGVGVGAGAGDDDEQRELLELAQRKLSEANAGGSGEDGKRFQATLELAAALLQQLQQRPKP